MEQSIFQYVCVHFHSYVAIFVTDSTSDEQSKFAETIDCYFLHKRLYIISLFSYLFTGLHKLKSLKGKSIS